MKRLLALVLLAGSVVPAWAQTINTARYSADFDRGTLTRLTDARGRELVRPAGPGGAALFRTGDRVHRAREQQQATPWDTESGGTVTFTELEDLPGASLTCSYEVDASSGDLVVMQRAESPEPGVWGVEWPITNVPLDLELIVPARSGIRLSGSSPGATQQLDYPVAWEAQLLIFQGEGYGFYIWADDPEGRFKRLTARRSNEGWRIGLVTINPAPFDALTHCESVPWHMNVFEGDWRVPARRYREWMRQHFQPTAVEQQQPAWVKDIRCCVIMGMDETLLAPLAERLHPTQTILYIPQWRAAGYDRNYPEYDNTLPELRPFIEQAHRIGFRVMLHVNYFGVDPLNPLYERFEPYQFRSPWGAHEKQWWTWDLANPPIKFAYINPACAEWRAFFTRCMAALCKEYGVDSLHLDQTLCIFNDNNGLVDGMTAVEGNIALHRQLREALPHVALSGEGLNEVTYRHEAFAQRHAWGVFHHEGTWSRPEIACAHPISSYLLRGGTIIYGYLGCAPPTQSQLYAAWNDAYEHWGVIPTLKPDTRLLEEPRGFARQFFDEVSFWQRERLVPAMEDAWPAHVAFPYRTASGERAVRTTDHRLVHEGAIVSQTVTGVRELETPGTIPGWRCYDEQHILGLDPQAWYPLFQDRRDPEAFHVTGMPEGFRPRVIAIHRRGGEAFAFVQTEQTDNIVADFGAMWNQAECRSQLFGQDVYEARGDLNAPDGAFFVSHGDVIYSHPPYKGGTGTASACFDIDLPENGDLSFITGVGMAPGSTGPDKTDGVTFGVTFSSGERSLHIGDHTDTTVARHLSADLTPFAGKRVRIEFTVHPGPEESPRFDWARWYAPRVERHVEMDGELTVAGKVPWGLAAVGDETLELDGGAGTTSVRAAFPGTVFLMTRPPGASGLPVDLAAATRWTSFVSNTGMLLEGPPHACAVNAAMRAGGVERDGLFMHPPNQGRTVVHVPLHLTAPGLFRAWVALREHAASEGVVFIVEANGREILREPVKESTEWREIRCGLAPWTGKPLVLTLAVDSDGLYNCDWACWGDPAVIGPVP